MQTIFSLLFSLILHQLYKA